MPTIQAVYERGTFRPTVPVDLPEHTAVEFEPRRVERTAAWRVDLEALAEQCGQDNWDGYQAARVLPETIRQATIVLESVPGDLPLPTLGAEPDGQVTLEWYRSPQQVVSVSVSPEGNLHYAAILGLRKAYGTEPFAGQFSTVLRDLIRGVANE